ncbi:MAG: OmpH family outer membrane protein [Pseudomonadota bacterium]
MKNRLFTVIGVALGFALLVSGVSTAQDLKIAFVDFQGLIGKSKKAQDQRKKIELLFGEKKKEFEAKKNSLVEMQEQLQKQGPMLKEETRNQKIKELTMKETELKLFEKEAQSSLQNEEREWMEVMQRDLTKILNSLRQERQYAFILSSTALMSADDAYNITDEVVKLYDESAGAAKRTEKPAAPSDKPKAAAPPKAKAPEKK